MFKQKIKSLTIGAAIMTLAMSASANEKSVEEKIKNDYKQINLQKVVPLKNINLYELTFLIDGQKEYAFTNENVDYLFLKSGEVLDLKNNVNITTEREDQRAIEFFKSLPFESAIAVKYGTGKHKIAVFSDPDCPFCQTMDQDFHQNLKEDVTIYYFMNPLVTIHPNAAQRASRILCDSNPAQAWMKYMTSAPGLDKNKAQSWNPETALPQNDGLCDNGKATKIVQQHYDLATENKFLSTPTIIFENGLVFKDRLKSSDVSLVLKQK